MLKTSPNRTSAQWPDSITIGLYGKSQKKQDQQSVMSKKLSYGVTTLQQCLLIWDGQQWKASQPLTSLANNGIHQNSSQESKREEHRSSKQEDYQVPQVQQMQHWLIWEVGSKDILMIGYHLELGLTRIPMEYQKACTTVSQLQLRIENGTLLRVSKLMPTKEQEWIRQQLSLLMKEKPLNTFLRFDPIC